MKKIHVEGHISITLKPLNNFLYKVVSEDDADEIEDDGWLVYPKSMQSEIKSKLDKKYHELKGTYMSDEPLRWADLLYESGLLSPSDDIKILEFNVKGLKTIKVDYEIGDFYILEDFVLHDAPIKVNKIYTISKYKKKKKIK